MTTRESLLAAVAANPTDNLPRLVYADWIEEQGQAERAELIRLEIAVRGGATDRPTLRAYRRAVASTPWHTDGERLEVAIALLDIDHTARRGITRTDYLTGLIALRIVVSPLFPGRDGLRRLVARYAAWEPPHGDAPLLLVTGHSTGYAVRPHFSTDPLGGRWVAGSGLTTIPGTGAACPEEAVLMGLAKRGEQRNFTGAVVSPAPRGRQFS